MRQVIHVDREYEDMRIDRFLRKSFPDMPLTAIHKLLRTKNVKVNKKRVGLACHLHTDDEIEIFVQEKKVLKFDSDQDQLVEAHITFTVIYEDQDILVVNKPPFVSMHTGAKQNTNTLIDQVRWYAWQNSGRDNPEHFYFPKIVHRIDRNTSGLVLFAKTPSVARQLMEQFRAKTIKKTYLALVCGEMKKKIGRIDLPLLKVGKEVVVKNDGKKSSTKYKMLVAKNNYSLLEVSPLTGRMHQIRVHLAEIGHPLAGDAKYGIAQINRDLREKYQLKRQFLHACKMVFVQPATKKKLTIRAPLTPDLKKVLDKMQIKYVD